MRMAVLQNVPFEGPAAIADWAEARGVPLREAHLYRGTELPRLDSFEMLTIMGGPMSANDETRFDWLGLEIVLIREAVAGGKIVLGICLGAQLIAKALGAKVYPAKVKEIGWFPVTRVGNQHEVLASFPETFTAFHWHGETFDLPDGATRLAETEAVPNQAFAVGPRALALQFHLEANPNSVRALLENASGEIGNGPYEQQPDAIIAGIGHCAAIRPHLYDVLDRLTGLGPQGK